MDLVEACLALVAAGIATAVLSLMVARSRAPADLRGWRYLRPGAMHWSAIGLGSGLCLLMVYVRLFVGSSRADAQTQMTILTGLILVFGLLTLATVIAVHGLWQRDVRWRGRRLAYRGRSGIEVRRFEEVVSVRLSSLGQAVLAFVDGKSLRIDLQATGTDELLELLQPQPSSPSDRSGWD